jgi:O-antigen ligase
MVQHAITWFHHRGSPDSETSVRLAVDGPSSASTWMPNLVQRDDSAARTVVSRRELWDAALRMFGARPLLGVGPDNFRHLYGPYLGRSVWDDRIHTNNLYLEVLVDLGVLGFLAFGVVLGVSISPLMRSLRAPTAGSAAPRVLMFGLAASLLAFLLHGFLDSFLEFTSIYVLFWMLLGLLVVAPSLHSETGVTV